MQDKLYLLSSRHATEPGHTTKRVSGALRSLPAQLTPLIGREHEIVAICTLLRCPEVRLLTLTGTGGVGKTRLALQIANSLLNDFAEGVCFVSLAPISDPGLVLPTIAQTLGLWEAGDRPLIEHLKAYLREKRVLLLLDNFEQVIQASPLLVELLQTCPGLKILVTSRAVLRISGEHEFLVSPLALPDLKQLPESAFLPQYAAVALFLQRTQAIKPDFQLTTANAPVIAEICVRLDGLPLALELAAARIKLLPPRALLKRLEHRLSVLTGGACNLPTRQQTLRDTIQWSYDLLSAEEQRLFRGLSVFVGGCTLEAVEAVCTTPGDVSEAGAVLEAVASLIDKSLLQQTEPEGEEPRLMMLETIREFGRECLHACGELEAARGAHAAYYLALAEEAEPKLTNVEQTVWLARLKREYEDLRAVLQWATEGGNEEAQLALRLSGALWQFWVLQEYPSEGRTFLERSLARSATVESAHRVKALIGVQILALLQGDYDQAEQASEEALALARKLGDQQGIAYALFGQGSVAFARSNSIVARSLMQESLTILRAIGDRYAVAYGLRSLGRAALLTNGAS